MFLRVAYSARSRLQVAAEVRVYLYETQLEHYNGMRGSEPRNPLQGDRCTKKGEGEKLFAKSLSPSPEYQQVDILPSFFSKNLKKGFCNSQIKALEHPMGFFRCYF